PTLDSLDEHPVLGSDLVVEGEEVGDPGLVRFRREEVVEEARRAAGAERVDRADRDVRTAREDVDPRVRPEEVELAAGDLPCDVEGPVVRANRTELARDEAARLELVGVHRDVDDLAETRMRDRAVVALEEVLANDLPVGVHLPVDP